MYISRITYSYIFYMDILDINNVTLHYYYIFYVQDFRKNVQVLKKRPNFLDIFMRNVLVDRINIEIS